MLPETRRRRSDRGDLTAELRKSWYRLRLSARHPSRAPTWDAIVLTAASPEQAELYDWQLRRARRAGRIAPSTVVLSVPDPGGARIGSGAATLHAISALARHFLRLGLGPSNVPNADEIGIVYDWSVEGPHFLPMLNFLAKKHVLLLHAGGDSKRVPWANPMGKVFLPLPYLARDDPDAPVPLLFDHILAVSSCAREALENKGGILIMTGDVLTCFDSSRLVIPDDASCIITVPITLDIASNHGVVVANKCGVVGENYALSPVDNLLQKPTMKELEKNQAILDDGRALLDTGIIAVRGSAWIELIRLAYSSTQMMIAELLKNKKEMSLYEDVVAAWVPGKQEWLKLRPLGKELVSALGSQKMFSYCAYDLSFLHFGTSVEVLDHLSEPDSGLVGRRHLCSVPDTTVSDIAASAVVLSSKISPGVSIGEDTLIYDSSLSGRIQIGSQSIVVGVSIHSQTSHGTSEDDFQFVLPDRHCLWEVPLVGCPGRVLIYCGLHDNPKISVQGNGTFCGKPWRKILYDLGIHEGDLWGSLKDHECCLWNAKIYPILSPPEMLNFCMWLMGSTHRDNEDILSKWRSSDRVSLESLHRSIDFPRLCKESENHQAALAAGIAKACITYGLFGRNISRLCEQVLQGDSTGAKACEEFLSLCCGCIVQNPRVLPQSRALQVQVDLHRACGQDFEAVSLEHKVWAAVANETALAVKYGAEGISATSFSSSTSQGSPDGFIKFQPRTARVELPVRVDFVGGWSDTPPWSLERPGGVLNMAITLEGSLPIGAEMETCEAPGLCMEDDTGNTDQIEDPRSIAAPFGEDDQFRLVKSALLVSGIIHSDLLSNSGLRIRTWARVPRGSGLGTSSILAAAVVKGLLHLMEGDESNDNVARIVLVVEQVMGTGGGWQDQIGGLYPGIKFTSSFPGQPLRLQVVPLVASPRMFSDLEARLLVVFTGQVRLANQVLQKVVTRYLRRDNLLISSIKRLAKLARIGRESLMSGEPDAIGDVMLEAWRLHQELDPYCSNVLVDRLFAFADPYCCGYKLVGAGGGGFALLLAKDRGCAEQLKTMLGEGRGFDGVRVYDWKVFLGDQGV